MPEIPFTCTSSTHISSQSNESASQRDTGQGKLMEEEKIDREVWKEKMNSLGVRQVSSPSIQVIYLLIVIYIVYSGRRKITTSELKLLRKINFEPKSKRFRRVQLKSTFTKHQSKIRMNLASSRKQKKLIERR